MADVVISSKTRVGYADKIQQFPYKIEWESLFGEHGGWWIFWVDASNETTQLNSEREFEATSGPTIQRAGPFPYQGAVTETVSRLKQKLGLSGDQVWWRVTALDPNTFEPVSHEPLQLDPP